MGTADVLSGATALVRRGYCIGPNAVDAKGVAVRAVDPGAAAWSLYGALLRATGVDDFRCQTSAAFAAVFAVLKDYHVPARGGWERRHR
jgi:hypothetical protein